MVTKINSKSKIVSLIFLFYPLFIYPQFAPVPAKGKASYYSVESCKREAIYFAKKTGKKKYKAKYWGIKTANGETFDDSLFTCAMPDRKMFGKWFKVTNLENNISVLVRCNDFGPGKKPRRRGVIIDLAKTPFYILTGDLKRGLCPVKVEVWK